MRSVDEIYRIRNSISPLGTQTTEYFQLKEDQKDNLIVELCDQIIEMVEIKKNPKFWEKTKVKI